MTLSIGIVGCGAIGQALIRSADSGQLNVPVAGVTSRDEHRAHEFLGALDSPPPYLDRPELIAPQIHDVQRRSRGPIVR